jgi:cobalt-zinc-cadmium efflux system outer membrane protein
MTTRLVKGFFVFFVRFVVMKGLLTITAAVLFANNLARAQMPPAHPTYVDAQGGLSLDEAIGRAIEQEPSLRAARTEIDVARGTRRQAGLRPNPTLSLERREEPAGTDNQTAVSVEWPLDLFRKTGRVQTAERELEATERSVADRERLLAAGVRMQYGQAAAAIRNVAVADDLVSAIRRQFELLRARVEEGASPPLERDLLDVELHRAESERLLAMGRADAAMVDLKRSLGWRADAQLALRDTMETLVLREQATADPAAAPQVDAVVQDRSDVREAEARLRLAEARIDRARREGRFDVSLFGMYMRMDAGFPQRGFDPAGGLERVRGVFHYLAGGAMVTVPFRNRNQGEIAAAEAARTGAEARLEAAELTARAEIAAAAARDGQAQRAVALFAGGVRGLARQNLDVVGQTYELGRATVFDVLTEQRRYLDIERAYTDALREAWEARTALKRALGDVR